MPTTPDHVRVGSGSPVVLLHGASASWRIWQPTIDALSRHHEVFAITMAGHRGGPPLGIDPRQVLVSTFVDSVERSLDTFGLDTPHVVGNSLGGRVSLELARRGRARSVTAFSPAAAWVSTSRVKRANFLFRSALLCSRIPGPRWLARRSARARRLYHSLAMQHGDRLPAAYVDEVHRDLCVTRDWLGHLGRNILSEGTMPPVPVSETPVCVAWGSRDRVIPYPGFGAPLRDLLPGAEFVHLPGCGHIPMWDDPELVVKTILRTTARA